MKKLIMMTLIASFVITSLASCSSDNNVANDSTNNVTSNTVNSSNTGDVTNNSSSNTVAISQVSSSDMFTDRDYSTAFDDSNYSTIDLSNVTCDNSNVLIEGSTFTIKTEGTYLVKGDIKDGQIIIDVEDAQKVQLMLDGVNIQNSNTAPIYVKQADKVFITTAKDSINTLEATLIEDESATTNIDGVIFSHDDITLNGEGILNINSINGNGIVGKDDLKITSGEYNITADKHGIEANNSIRIANGIFDISAQKDGMHCDDSDIEKGYIYILDGNFNIDVDGDGLDSSNFIEIVSGEYNIKTGGGYANAPVKVAEANNHGGGMMGGRGDNTQMTQSRPNDMMMQGQQGDFPQEITDEMMAMREEMMQGRPNDMMMGGQQGEFSQEMTDEMMAMREEMMQGRPNDMMMEGQQGQQNNTQMQGRPEMQQPLESAPPLDTTTTSTEDDGISRKAIKSSGDLIIQSGTFNIDAYDDAFHSNQNLLVRGGVYNVGTADDAFHADLNTTIEGGKILIENCHEGIEGQTIDIKGGYIDITCNDDGLNSASDLEGEIYINISGGEIYIDGILECDGLDSNGNLYMSGGYIQISGTTETRDTVLDFEKTGEITGGTFIATGSNSMTLQNFDTTSTQGSIVVVLDTLQSGQVTLTDDNGTVLVDITPPKDYQAVTISLPELEVGGKYNLVTGSTTTEIEMDTLIYGGGKISAGGMGGMGGRR